MPSALGVSSPLRPKGPSYRPPHQHWLDVAARTIYITAETGKDASVTDIGQAVLDAIADLKTTMDRKFEAVDRRFEAVDGRFDAVDRRFDAADGRFTAIDGRLDAIEEQLAPMRAQLDGLPLINRAVTVIQQDARALKPAFNDFALTNPTTGEIQALHEDVNRVQAENAELARKVATLERLVRELQERVSLPN
jgi:chromosome segregation ATPase